MSEKNIRIMSHQSRLYGVDDSSLVGLKIIAIEQLIRKINITFFGPYSDSPEEVERKMIKVDTLQAQIEVLKRSL